MKILLAVDKYPVPSETFVRDHVEAMIRLGHQVEVLAAATGGSFPDGEARLHDLGAAVHGWRRPAGALRALKPGSVSWRLLRELLRDRREGRSGGNSLGPLIASRRLRCLGAFDLVHVHTGSSALFVQHLMAAGVLSGPLVVTFHGTDLNSRKKVPNSVFYRHVLARAVACTVGSEFMRGVLLEADCPPEKIRLMPMGVDSEVVASHRCCRYESEPARLLSVGRLVENKGTVFALRAVKILLERGVDVRYYIIGYGPLDASLRREADQMGISDRVEFLGARSHHEVFEYVSASTLLVHPSVHASDGSCEAQGVALLEAQALGLPVVGSSVGGIPSTVLHGETGLLIPEADPDLLATAIERLLSDPIMWAAYSRRARTHVLPRFDQKRLMAEWQSLYETLAA